MIELSRRGVLQSILTALVALLTVVALLLPMGEFPLWNGENPGHRNQYELMAEAILDGRITFDYGDEDSLASLENPYDPEARKAARKILLFSSSLQIASHLAYSVRFASSRCPT